MEILDSKLFHDFHGTLTGQEVVTSQKLYKDASSCLCKWRMQYDKRAFS